MVSNVLWGFGIGSHIYRNELEFRTANDYARHAKLHKIMRRNDVV